MDIQTQTFQNLNNLQTLDLSSNKLLYLPALPLPKLLTLNLQASGLKGVNQAIVHTLPRLRDLLLEHNPIKCSDLLGIAEWASPCRISDRNELTTIDIVNNNNNSQPNVGQLTTPTAANIDLKAKYERLNSFFEKFHSTCSRQALRFSRSQQGTSQASCLKDIRKNIERSSTNSELLAPQITEMLQNDDANVAPQENQPETVTKSSTFNAFESKTVTETLYKPINLTIANFVSYSLAKREPATTTLITPVKYINATETIVDTTQAITTINENMKSGTVSGSLTVKFQNNIVVTTAMPSEVNETAKMQHSNKMNSDKKVVTLKLPKNSKGSKFDFSVMSSSKQLQKEKKLNKEAINVTSKISTLTATTESLSLMEKDILATQQTVDKLQPTEAANSLKPTVVSNFEHAHKHVPLQLQLKDRHLIGTPLLTHKGQNILVESDELKNLPKSSKSTTTLATSQIPNTRETKWPRDITGINENDDENTADTLQINKNVKLEHDKDKKKATLKLQNMLTTHSKYNAAKMLDTNDYDIGLMAETTMPPSEEQSQAVTPMHKHSTVNMPIHYKQPHEIHTFHELQLQKLQFQEKHADGINKDTQSEHWLDARKPQSNSHPVFVILLSSLLFITLLFGLLHVYRCDMPWRHHLAPPRPHQHHLTDDDQHSFLHFQHNNAIYDDLTTTAAMNAAYRKNYNSPLHHLHAHDLTLKAETIVSTATSNYTLSNSSSGSSTGCCNNSPQSHVSSRFEGESCYVELTPVVSTQNNLLPMELLSVSSRNSKSNEYSELNTLGSRLTEVRAKQAMTTTKTTTISGLTEHTEVIDLGSSTLANNEPNLLQKARCSNTSKTTFTAERTPTARKFDLW